MSRVLILNGPNLNLLGQREREHYGELTLDEIQEFTQKRIKESYPQLELVWFQSNLEGELINQIQQVEKMSGIVINPGGYSHTSVAIADALKLFKGPKVEVHLSKVGLREEFRQRRVTATSVDMTLEGAGKFAYLLGIEYIQELQK